MSEKELLYVEDMLGHLSYLKNHVLINEECLNDSKMCSTLQKIVKKVDALYQEFYDLLGGE